MHDDSLDIQSQFSLEGKLPGSPAARVTSAI
jgi:hypothetical protein